MQFDAAPLTALRPAIHLALAFSVIKLAIHICANWIGPLNGYGFFRDELYFLDCGRRLAWGYVDQAPMVALQARVAEILFGHSLVGIRLFSALAGCATVFLTGILVWACGGFLLAQAVAMTAVLLSPFYLGIDSYLSMNSFEPVFWMSIALLAIMLARGENPRWWLVIGLLCGLGVENKQGTIFFIIALVTGMLLSLQKRLLRSRWVPGAIAIAIAIAMPNLFWQMHNGWPTWQFLHNPARPIIHHSLLGFIRQQLLLFNIISLFWIPGVFWLLFSKSAYRFRFLAIGYIVFVFLMFALHAKNYYLAPYYLVLIAAGAVAWERSTQNRRWAMATVLSLLVIYDLALLPMALPVLKPEIYLKYRNTVNARIMRSSTDPEANSLGQWFADRFGWPEMVENVAKAYESLPPSEKSRTAILSQFYGDASAIDILGDKYGLPQAISGNQNFWLWGPRGYDGENVIAVGFSRDEIPPMFRSVTQVGQVYSRYSMDYENQPIFLCKGMHPSLLQYWPRLKNWR